MEYDLYIESSQISLVHDSCCTPSNISVNETPSSHTVIQEENVVDIDHCLATPNQ